MFKEEGPFPSIPIMNPPQHGCAHKTKSTEFKSKNRTSLTNTFYVFRLSFIVHFPQMPANH